MFTYEWVYLWEYKEKVFEKRLDRESKFHCHRHEKMIREKWKRYIINWNLKLIFYFLNPNLNNNFKLKVNSNGRNYGARIAFRKNKFFNLVTDLAGVFKLSFCTTLALIFKPKLNFKKKKNTNYCAAEECAKKLKHYPREWFGQKKHKVIWQKNIFFYFLISYT